MLRRWAAISKRSRPEDLSQPPHAASLLPYLVTAANAESADALRLKAIPWLRVNEVRRAGLFSDHLDIISSFSALASGSSHVYHRCITTSRKFSTTKTSAGCRHLHNMHLRYQQQQISPLLSDSLQDDYAGSKTDSESRAELEEATGNQDFEKKHPQPTGAIEPLNQESSDFFNPSVTMKLPQNTNGAAVDSSTRPNNVKSLQASKVPYKLLSRAKLHIEAQNYSRALKSVAKAVRSGANVESSTFRHVCGLLLRGAPKESGNDQYSTGILSALLKLGVRPDIAMYNSLIQKAVRLGDPATAWEIYNLIRANGISPNDVTYVTLMKLCRKTNDKRAYFQLHMHLQPEHADSLSSHLITEVLTCRHYLEDQYNFDHMLRAYERHCDLQPLRDLGLIEPDHTSRSLATHPLPRPMPSGETLNVMLMAFLKSHGNLKSILATYGKFQECLKTGVPSILSLLANNSTYHIFMRAASRFPVAFGIRRGAERQRAPQLLWYNMLKAMTTPPSFIWKRRRLKETVPPLKPNADTWGIIASSYAQEGRVAESEAILEMMRNHSLAIDSKTLNSILSRLSRTQRVENVAQVFHHIKARGIAVDDKTARSLSQIKDKESLLKKIRELQTTKETKVSTRSDGK